MRVPRRLGVLLVLLVLVGATLAGNGSALTSGGPFYVVPSAKNASTTECHDLAYCYGIRGPWVVVPAQGEATFLFGCPERSQQLGPYLLAGSDALASSSHVHVWYDGWLGAPLGSATQHASSGLLFHAETDNGQPGSFEPVLGCVALLQSSKLSTVDVRLPPVPPAGVHVSLPPTLHSTQVLLEPGWNRTITLGCPKAETLIGGWSSAAFNTQGPPVFPHAHPVAMKTADHGNVEHVQINTAGWIPYLIQIQVGTMCES